MISIGTVKDMSRITKKFAVENQFSGDKEFMRKFRYFVYKQHRIGDSDKYNLTNVDVTCKVFYHRWLTGA